METALGLADAVGFEAAGAGFGIDSEMIKNRPDIEDVANEARLAIIFWPDSGLGSKTRSS